MNNNKHLDIIRYISFRVKNKGSLKIITLPVAIEEKSELTEYFYDISNEKYFEFMKKINVYRGICNIYTVFGNKYKGYFSILENKNLKVHSHEKMRYKNIYFSSIENKYKRFKLMEI